MDFLDKLEWRYATKQFDPNKKLSTEQLNSILKAINLAPTSYGLQPFQVIVIEDDTLKARLRKASWDQPQVTDASQVIIFAANNNLSTSHVDEFLTRISEVTGATEASLAEYAMMMKNKLKSMNQEELLKWASKQCYIGLGFLLSACASLKVDACPMEGFIPDQFNDILGLKERNLSSVVMATIGFRSENDKNQHNPKVRKKLDDLIIKF